MAEARHITDLGPEELAEEGYGPRAIASASKLPQSLVEEILHHASSKGGGGNSYGGM